MPHDTPPRAGGRRSATSVDCGICGQLVQTRKTKGGNDDMVRIVRQHLDPATGIECIGSFETVELS